MLRIAPKAFNSAFNRGFSSTMGAFTRKFARERLRKGGVQVRRRTSGGGRSAGVFVPRKMKALGFKGVLSGRKKLQRKFAEVRTRNPVAIAHEEGATIRPRRGNFLVIPVRNVSAARRAGVSIPRGSRPAFLRVRQVRLKARLQFLATFRRFQPEAIRRLNQALQRGAESAIRQAKRRAKGSKGRIVRGVQFGQVAAFRRVA